MIDLAINHIDKLTKAFRATWFVDKYKFYNSAPAYYDIKLEDNTMYKQEYVSLDKDNNLIGFIIYDINPNTHSVVNLGLINFTDNTTVFASDCLKTLRELFDKFHYHKVSFYTVIGNPAEPKYDKLVEMLGGSVCGYKKDETKLYDNQYYDCKFYEILEKDYLERKNKKWELLMH